MSVVRTYRIRLYPTVSQEVALLDTVRLCKNAWNTLKTLIQGEYENTGKTLGYYDLCKKTVVLKQIEPKYRKLYSQVLRNVAKRLRDSYTVFFSKRKNSDSKTRLPRFKTLKHYHSFTYPQVYQQGVSFNGNRVKLSKIGNIKYRGNLPEGKIKSFTVKRLKTGKWMGYITYEKTLELVDAGLPVVGIDLGLEKFAVLSDGNYIPIPQFYRQDEKRIKKAHRNLSRKQRESNNYWKAKIKLAKAYEGVSNKRLDFLHKTSTWIADHYSVVCVENLNIKGISQGLRLGKSVHDASWRKFLDLLEYKLEERNGLLVYVDPRYTSQTCSNCGETVKKALNNRMHHCINCGLTLDRDLNAARNILRKGIGIDDAEFTPTDIDTSTNQLRLASVVDELGTTRRV